MNECYKIFVRELLGKCKIITKIIHINDGLNKLSKRPINSDRQLIHVSFAYRVVCADLLVYNVGIARE